MITTVLPFTVYAYQTWSVTLREEYMLRVFKNNRVLGKIFGPSKEEMKGDWRKLYIYELQNITSHWIKYNSFIWHQRHWTGAGLSGNLFGLAHSTETETRVLSN